MATDNFLARFKLTQHSALVAAGSTDIEPTNGIDQAGFQSCVFLVSIGAVVATAVSGIRLQQSSVIDGTGDAFVDIAGTAQVIADDDDNKIIAVEIVGAAERFVRCVIDRATANLTLNGIIAIQHGGAITAVVHDSATVIGTEIHVGPVAGTA